MKGVIGECDSFAEVQQMTEKLDVASLVPLHIDDNGVMKSVDNFKGIYNNTRGKFCATVVNHYNLVQHKDYFDNVAQALSRLNIKYKMTIKTSNNRAFADIEFKDRNLKFDKLNEEFTTGLRLSNSYDKTTGLGLAPRFTRLACTNGMILTRNEKVLSIKHHSKIAKEIEKFIEVRINEIINKDYELKGWVSGAMKDSIEWKLACKIIEKLFSQIKHREQVLKRLGLSIVEVEDKKTKKKNVTYVWDNLENKKAKFTRWEMYNAVTNYVTHGEQITPHVENIFQGYAEKLLTTPLLKLPRAEGI